MSTGRVSLIPTDFAQGGLIDDIDATVTMAKFCNWDYDGKSDKVGIFLAMLLQDADGKEHAQYWSAGDPEFFQPGDAEGSWLKSVGTRPAMNNNTNAAMLLMSLVAAGFPQDRLNTLGIGEALVGMKAHWNQVAQPKRKGLIKTGNQGSDEREKSTLLVSAILQLPGQVAKPAATGLGVTSGNAAKPTLVPTAASAVKPGLAVPATGASPAAPASPTNGAAVDPAVDEAATIGLLEILMENGGSVVKANLPALAFKKFSAHPSKGKIVPRIYSVDFLMTTMGITFDGTTVTMQ